MSRERDLRDARQGVAAYLRVAYPVAQWDAIDDLGRALTHELYVGPMPHNYWNDKAEGDALCVHWFGWSEACKHLSALIDGLPDVYWDVDAGSVAGLADPYDDPHNWEADDTWPGDEPGTDPNQRYVGPTDYVVVPAIEALFDKELWRYLT